MDRLDHVRDALLPGLAPRVRPLADVLLGEVVDVLFGRVAGDLVDDPALDARRPVAPIRALVQREGDPWIVVDVARLLPAEGRVEEDFAVALPGPDRARLRG